MDKKIRQLVIMVAAILLIIFCIQIYWTTSAYEKGEVEFNKKVAEILRAVAQEANDHIECFELFSKTYIKPNEGFYIVKHPWTNTAEKIQKYTGMPDTIPMHIAKSQSEGWFNFKNLKFSSPIRLEMSLKFRYLLNSSSEQNDSALSMLEKMTVSNFKNMLYGNEPVYKTYDTLLIDSLLRHHFEMENVYSKYHFGYIRTENDSVEYMKSGTQKDKLLNASVQIPLSNDTYFLRPYKLAVYFDNKSRIILVSVWGLLISSAAVIIILVGAFLYFIKTLLAQKQLSEMKTDFINNMTHEFNTPISNIALSVETLAENGQAHHHETQNILDIIGKENDRMRENVERILQIAAVEKGKWTITPSNVDIDELIRTVIHGMELKASHYNASVNYHSAASAFTIYADETHLINVIENLVDNALKYGGKKPVVNVSLKNSDDGITFSVEDKGIGISRKNISRIFDSFFRVETGNIHNVKGFGLGLSYVKSIVEAHNGTISVKSYPDKGSCFEIWLPFFYK